ncbi:MAG: DUF134 domain-containing protein [Bacteroidales bacterium]|nr:DUF134 domain-containing protein [Bacteroidales bacterium]
MFDIFVTNICSIKMPRPKRIRKVTTPPHYKGYKPLGVSENLEPVILNYEEYEAIRLCDFELLGQVEASQLMAVSRPTFTRIYESARRKVAEAFVKGSAIVFEGGKVYYDSEWYICNSCGCWFNHLAKDEEIKYCSLCGSEDIEQYNEPTEAVTNTDKTNIY